MKAVGMKSIDEDDEEKIKDFSRGECAECVKGQSSVG